MLRISVLSLLAAGAVLTLFSSDSEAARRRIRREYRDDRYERRPEGLVGKTLLSFSAGPTQLTEDEGDVFDTGPALGVHLLHGVAPFAAVGVGVGYHHFGMDEDVERLLSDEAGEVIDVRRRIVPVTAELLLGFPASGSAVIPYFSFGMGPYFANLEEKSTVGNVTVLTDDEETDLGFNFGGGFSFPVSRGVRFGAGAKYHVIFEEERERVTERPRVDDTFEFWDLQMSLAFEL